MANAPTLYRVILQVSDLDQAAAFYAKLLADEGRRITRASRHYIDCGPVILALVDPAPGGEEAKPLPDYFYFAVTDLEQMHARARELGCLSTEDVHGDSAGDMVIRPWAERSFYVKDPGQWALLRGRKDAFHRPLGDHLKEGTHESCRWCNRFAGK